MVGTSRKYIAIALIVCFTVHLTAPYISVVRARMGVVPAFCLAALGGGLIGAVATVGLASLFVATGPLGFVLGAAAGPLLGHGMTIAIYNGLRGLNTTSRPFIAFVGSVFTAVATTAMLMSTIGPFFAGFLGTGAALLAYNLIAGTQREGSAWAPGSTETSTVRASADHNLTPAASPSVTADVESLAEQRRQLYRRVTTAGEATSVAEVYQQYQATDEALRQKMKGGGSR